MKVNLKKDWKFFSILIFSIILIILISTYTLSIENKLYTKGVMQETTGAIEDIRPQTEILQEFIAIDNNLEKIIIDFEPYKDDVNCGGKVRIGIKDSYENIIKEEEITRNYIRENTKYTLKFNKQKESKDKNYSIFIKFENLEDYNRFYTLKYTEKNEFENNKLYINENEQVGESLIFQDLYKSNIRVNIFWTIMLLMILCIFIISTIIYYKKNIKEEHLFLMIAPIVCIFFMLVMPTFKSHDEYYHWLKAYEVSEGNLMTPIKDGIQGSIMPDSVAEVFPSDWIHMTYSDAKEILNVKLNEEEQGILNPETAAVYSFVQYVPQAIGICIGRLVTDNVYIITYAGRAINMMFAILILYLAIKITPFGKKLLLIPAMIPIAIEGFTSLSPDAMTISISFLYIAYILYLAFGNKEKVKIKDKAILLLLSIIIALCKIVYIPLVMLILIIPKYKFKNESNKNKLLNFIIIAGIAIIINLSWLAISSRYLSTFREGDSTVQVMLAISNPIEYLQKLLYTVNLYGNKYTMSLFGSELGWGELVKLYSIIPYAFLGIYCFSAIIDDEIKGKFEKYQIFWMALVVIAILGLIFTSLYVQWTVVGSNRIEGVQGRYFLPILPLITILIASKIKVKTLYQKENINKFVAISTLVLQIYTISQILIVHL